MKYDLIYTDPPWKYERNSFWAHGGLQGEAAFEYPLMDFDELAALRGQVDEWAAPDCVMFMWATWPRLDLAMRLGPAWGFSYVTCGFVWVKTLGHQDQGHLFPGNPHAMTFCGLGFHARGNTEPCLLFKRGSPGIFEDRNIRQLVFAPRREHSRKPDEVRELIERAYPNARRLEMFARTTRPGWDVFGNQTEKFAS